MRRTRSRRLDRAGLSRSTFRPQLESLERRDLLTGYTTLEDTPLAVSDSTLAGAVVVTPPEHGKVYLANTGGFIYSPNANYNGSDRFTYSTSPPAGTLPVRCSMYAPDLFPCDFPSTAQR